MALPQYDPDFRTVSLQNISILLICLTAAAIAWFLLQRAVCVGGLGELVHESIIRESG